jgi:hypothetical protein
MRGLMPAPLPPNWSEEDIRFLIEQIAEHGAVLVMDEALGIPPVKSLQASRIEILDEGWARATTAAAVLRFDTGLATPSGQRWTYPVVEGGHFCYDRQNALARLNGYLDLPPAGEPLMVTDEGNRLVAANSTLKAVCPCRTDASGRKPGTWSLYHAGNFLGIPDPESGKQIAAEDLSEVIDRASLLYGVRFILGYSTK